MNKISAEILADSQNEHGQRITTFKVIFPRIVLAEFNTHRMLSRNSASSRAIPFEKMLNRLETEPFIPIKFQKDHTGMQGTEYFEGQEAELAKAHWLTARDRAVQVATNMSKDKVTKQLCNRLLEPFMYHTVIVTGTEWENFFKLRAHDAAEIHIADLAYKMLDLYNESIPKELKAGQWHIPFADNMDEDRIKEFMHNSDIEGEGLGELDVEAVAIRIATARCARVSYLNYEGNDDYSADIKLYDRLSSLGHWSPFEHCAKAMSKEEIWTTYGTKAENAAGNGWSGNYQGFIQLRKTFEGENAQDSRVVRK